MWKGCLGLSLVVSGAMSRAWAASDALSVPVNKMEAGIKNKRFEEDKRITDIELKARAGSLSRYSVKFDLGYNGPPINDLSSVEMPNPDNKARNNKTNISGTVGIRLRLSPSDAINASTGVKWFAPYQSVSGESVPLRKGEKIFDTASPALSYDRTSRRGNLQFRTSAKGSATTDAYYKSRGQFGSIGFEEFLKYNVGQTRWVLGFLMDLNVFLFNRRWEPADNRVSNYNLNMIPSVEYMILDNLYFKTSWSYSFLDPRSSHSWATWERQMITQRVGVGWAITRDVYVNPYLNFFVDRPTIDTTSLAMTTVFSVF